MVVVWPVLGRRAGTWRNSGPGPKTKKRNFPQLGVPEQRGNKPRCPRWFSATVLRCAFRPTGPPRAGNRKIWGFWAVLAQDGLRDLEKSRARAEIGKKTRFPGARGPETEKKTGYHTIQDGGPQLFYILRCWGGGIRPPKKFLPEILHLFLHLKFWPPGPPRARNRKTLFFWSCWPRTAFWYLDRFQVENIKTRPAGPRAGPAAEGVQKQR